MTVPAENPFTTFIGDGSTVAFTVPFTWTDSVDVQAVYSVAGVPVAAGYSVTGTSGNSQVVFNVAPASGATGLMWRTTPIAQVQAAPFESGGNFPNQALAAGLDQLTRVSADLALLLSTAAKVPLGNSGPVLPTAEQMIGMYLVGDVNGNLIPSSGTGADAGLRADLANGSGALGGALVALNDGAGGTIFSSAQQLAAYVTPQLHQLQPSTTVDQSAEIQALFNAYAGTGIRLKLAPGTYICTNITIPGLLWLEADATYRTVLQHTPGATTPMFVIPAKPVIYVGFGGCWIEGNGLTGETLILLQGVQQTVSPYDGGIWNSYFHDAIFTGCGGKIIWSRGGNKRASGTTNVSNTPNQFLHFARCHFLRPATPSSRCVSMTGQHGQIMFDGECQFDSSYNTAGSRFGANIVLSREWTNGTLYGDFFDGNVEVTGTYPAQYSSNTFTPASGWYPIDALSPIDVEIHGGSTECSRYGIVTDNAFISINDVWFENLDRAITATSSSIVTVNDCHFANAGGSASQGWCMKAENSVIIAKGNNFSGSWDMLSVEYIGKIINVGGNVTALSQTAEGYSIGASQQTSISSGVVALGYRDNVFVASSGTISNPTNLSTFTSFLTAGSKITFTVSSGYVRLVTGGNIYFSGGGNANAAPVLGPGDGFTAYRGDTVNGSAQWIVTGISTTNPEGFPGISVNGDASATVQAYSSTITQYWNAPLTANRTVTINGGTLGQRFKFVRAAASTGSSTLTISATGTVLAAGQWVEVTSTGSGVWVVTAFGTGA